MIFLIDWLGDECRPKPGTVFNNSSIVDHKNWAWHINVLWFGFIFWPHHRGCFVSFIEMVEGLRIRREKKHALISHWAKSPDSNPVWKTAPTSMFFSLFTHYRISMLVGSDADRLPSWKFMVLRVSEIIFAVISLNDDRVRRWKIIRSLYLLAHLAKNHCTAT